MPALYNVARQFEVPIPQTSPPHVLIDERILDENEEAIEQQNDDEVENKPNLPLLEVILNEDDSEAVNDIFNNGTEEPEGLELELEPESKSKSDENYIENMAFDTNGAQIVIRKYSDGFEMTYNLDEIPKPKPPPRYEMKRNDIISKNYPFVENVSVFIKSNFEIFHSLIYSQENGDRAYSVQLVDSFKEMTMAARVINGL